MPRLTRAGLAHRMAWRTAGQPMASLVPPGQSEVRSAGGWQVPAGRRRLTGQSRRLVSPAVLAVAVLAACHLRLASGRHSAAARPGPPGRLALLLLRVPLSLPLMPRRALR